MRNDNNENWSNTSTYLSVVAPGHHVHRLVHVLEQRQPADGDPAGGVAADLTLRTEHPHGHGAAGAQVREHVFNLREREMVNANRI